MVIITMGFDAQYFWHLGEPFPPEAERLDRVIHVSIDGDELEKIRHEDVNHLYGRQQSWESVDVDEARHAVEFFLSE